MNTDNASVSTNQMVLGSGSSAPIAACMPMNLPTIPTPRPYPTGCSQSKKLSLLFLTCLLRAAPPSRSVRLAHTRGVPTVKSHRACPAGVGTLCARPHPLDAGAPTAARHTLCPRLTRPIGRPPAGLARHRHGGLHNHPRPTAAGGLAVEAHAAGAAGPAAGGADGKRPRARPAALVQRTHSAGDADGGVPPTAAWAARRAVADVGRGGCGRGGMGRARG